MDPDKKKHFHNAAPLLIVVCLLPFVVYGHIYEYSGDSFGTFIADIPFFDFFSYSKSLVFGTVGTYMLCRIVYDMKQGRMTRPCFVLTVCFSVLAFSLLVSGIFALNSHLAFLGGYQRFEGVITKLFYLVLALYTYNVIGSREVRRIVWKGAIATAAIECLVGLAQMTGHDPFASPVIQSIILPAEYRGSEISNILGDNRVYLTLANPNYAAIYLAVMIILITYSIGAVKRRRWQIGLAVLDALCFAELVATRSRIGIVMLTTAAILWIILNIGAILADKKKMLAGCAFVAAILLVGVATDAIMGLGAWDRLGESLTTLGQDRVNCRVTGLETGQDSVNIELSDISVTVTFKDVSNADQLKVSSVRDGSDYGKYDPGTGMIVDNDRKAVAGLEDLLITSEVSGVPDEVPEIIIKESDAEFRFAYFDGYGYLIYSGNGYYEETEDIPYVDMHGLESAASGRGYIWSRTLPLMTGLSLITGYGSDNFYLAFPQNDFVGKAQYCESPLTIIEKPHNTFLLYGVENGILAMLAIIVLFAVLIHRSARAGKHGSPECMLIALIMTAYAVGLFFNDSSIVISPLLWITIGAGYRFIDPATS